MKQNQLEELQQLIDLQSNNKGTLVYNAPGSISVGTIEKLEIDKLISGDPEILKSILQLSKKIVTKHQSLKDEDLAQILTECLEAIDDDGKKVFTERYQWYAVYRVLCEKCNYRMQMPAFVQNMKELGMNKVSVPCKYTSIKYATVICPLLAVPVDKWQQYKGMSQQYKKMYKLAALLINKIESANQNTNDTN